MSRKAFKKIRLKRTEVTHDDGKQRLKSGRENIIHAARTPEEMRAKTANSCAVIVIGRKETGMFEDAGYWGCNRGDLDT